MPPAPKNVLQPLKPLPLALVLADLEVRPDRVRTIGDPPATPHAVELYSLTAKLSGLRPAGFHVYDGHRKDKILADRHAAVAT